jgi:hypothetical protein
MVILPIARFAQEMTSDVVSLVPEHVDDVSEKIQLRDREIF